MKITYKGDYALKTILDLAAHFGNGPVVINDLSRRLDIPTKFLEQILLDLKRAGFVESRRGKVGGYSLAKEPGKIALGEVVRYIDGPIEPIACLKDKYSNCADINRCVFKKLWNEVYQATADIIDNVTFEELASEVNLSNQVLAYSI